MSEALLLAASAQTDPAAFARRVMDARDIDMDEFCGGWNRNRETYIDGVMITWDIVESEGGGEGEGETVTRVFKFNIGGEATVFMRTGGFYESYNGTEWDNEWKVVYPREVVVTQYFDTP